MGVNVDLGGQHLFRDRFTHDFLEFEMCIRDRYFTSKGEISTRNDFYRVGFNGKHQQRLTFGEYNHKNIMLSPDNRYFMTWYDNSSTPTRLGLVNVKNGKIKVLGDLKDSGIDSTKVGRKEMLWLTTKEGFKIPAIVYWPSNMKEGDDIHWIFMYMEGLTGGL